MKNHIWCFEFRKGSQVLDHFKATCTECHRKGDTLATRIGSVECFAFNEPLNRWDKIGVYRGNYVFTDSWGEDRRMKWDYSGMAPMSRKEVAV